MKYNIDNLELDVEIIKKISNKRTYIRCLYPNKVIIKGGRYFKNSDVDRLLNEALPFIKRSLKKLNENNNLNKDIIHFNGKEYQYEIKLSNYKHIEIEEDKIIFYVFSSSDNLKEMYEYFLFNNLVKFVKEEIIIAKNKLNINFDVKLSFKKVKTYFGECYPKRKEIIFNIDLMRYDSIYIKSVIYHELAHFYHLNHSKQFYDLLDDVFENYRQVQKEMKKIKYYDSI